VRILLIRPGALGDVVLTLPAVQALEQQTAEACVEMVGNDAAVRLLCGRSAVRAVWSFDALDVGLFHASVEPAEDTAKWLGEYDLIVNYGAADSAFAQNLSRLGRGRVFHCETRPGPGIPMHMSEWLQQPMLSLGLALCTDAPRLRLIQEDQSQAASWREERGLRNGRAVALHPGSGSAGKNWPADRFAAVASCLAAANYQVVLVRGPADAMSARAVQRAMGAVPSTLASDLPLPILAAVLERCAAYIGNDSGISHLAAAVGLPVVAIFGPTDPKVWAPRGQAVKVVRGNNIKGGQGQELSDYDIKTVTLDAVIEAVQEVSGLPVA